MGIEVESLKVINWSRSNGTFREQVTTQTDLDKGVNGGQ